MNQTAQPDLSNAHVTIYKALRSLPSIERLRLIESVLALLGEPVTVSLTTPAKNSPSPTPLAPVPSPATRAATGAAKAFFDSKRPNSKVEEYVVAAVFLKKKTGKAAFSKEDLSRTISDAGRHFNRDKFKRDVENARAAGFLSRNASNNMLTLLPRGQQYVDRLPEHPATTGASQRKSPSRAKPSPQAKKSVKAKQAAPKALARKTSGSTRKTGDTTPHVTQAEAEIVHQ